MILLGKAGLRRSLVHTWMRPARRGVAAFGVALAAGCYATGDGSAPPDKNFYFPVGLVVSPGGSVLYAVNSDFDLQWNGGTLQSYDLDAIRTDTVKTIQDSTYPSSQPGLVVRPAPANGSAACPGAPPLYQDDGSGQRQPLGQTCAPPVDSNFYVRDSAIIGAFATDLQRFQPRAAPTKNAPTTQRLFVPVRGDASVTWADVASDVDPGGNPIGPPFTTPNPFLLDCGLRDNNRCDAAHHAGNDSNESGNTRHVTMPGEPFGMALSEDGSALALTHQTDTKTSLLSTGLDPANPGTILNGAAPFLNFVLDGLPVGGNGIAAIPHDTNAFLSCLPPALPAGSPCPVAPRPAFLQTSRAVAELDLLRLYTDQGVNDQSSSLARPFMIREASFPLTANSGGTDSRGIIIDPTPRIACEKKVDQTVTPTRTQGAINADLVACARRPARVFFANRTPASLIIGEIGEPSASGDGTFDADRLAIFGNVPLTFGPSKLYLAPIVDQDGNYALRVFIICFDSATIFVYDPDAGSVEAIIPTGVGPYAMAFDPFSLEDAAQHHAVPKDPRHADLVTQLNPSETRPLLAYRFAYVASFTDSFVQVIDLDNSLVSKDTFERVVYTLGNPTIPKGSQ